MNIAVVLRHVPDLVEPLEIDGSGAAFDLSSAAFVLNECDDHALEQALLLKEAAGATVTVVALDFGDPDNSLYAAAAKGADRLVKIALAADTPPSPRAAAALLAGVIKGLSPDLVLVGVQAHDELDGVLAPMLAAAMGLPYVGVIRGVKPAAGPGEVAACKEFPGAVMARMAVRLPAVLGILAADQAPRYVPVSRIRAAMKTAQLDAQAVDLPDVASGVAVCRLSAPTAASRAQMLAGSESEVAARIADILAEKGLLK